jgi:hypothetical protein
VRSCSTFAATWGCAKKILTKNERSFITLRLK